MRILLIADGRSPITKNWIHMLSGLKHEIYLLSTFPHEPINTVEESITVPLGFSKFAGGQIRGGVKGKRSLMRSFIAFFRPLLMRLRAAITPLTLGGKQVKFLEYVLKIKPDMVHALRIPFEGMLGSALFDGVPFVVSIWGNDLTLHAKSSFLMGRKTRKTLHHADGVMADTAYDIGLARGLGIRKAVPTTVVPGSGGLDLEKMKIENNSAARRKFALPENVPLIINPRGFRPGSVHQEVFFACIPHVLARYPEAHFVCPGMEGQPTAEKWIRQYGIKNSVTLLPFLAQEDLWAINSAADIYVSLSSHDGTPNSFLEAIAVGCFPVVGDIPALREWIKHGQNGLLVDPLNTTAAAEAIISAIGNKKLRDSAAQLNQREVRERADINRIRKMVEKFYLQVMKD
ncbi:MAG: glycosyltransferase [Anaerolineaceae bacterium]|nr:glycosyltransferase [Anaerolineaceae bacterium]